MSNTSLLGSFGGQAGDALMFRNRIINGGMDIWQRGDNTTGSGYFADRWLILSGVTTAVENAAGSPAGFRRNALITRNVSGSVIIAQRIEAKNCYDLVGQSVTVTFYHVSNAGQIDSIKVGLKYANTEDTFSATTLIQEVTLSSSATGWKTVTFNALPSQAANGLQLEFTYAVTGSSSVRLTGVQLEAGPTATPFERRPIGVETMLCKRYCHVVVATGASFLGISKGTGGTSTDCWIYFPTTMRPGTMTYASTATITFTPYAYVTGTMATATTSAPSINFFDTNKCLLSVSGHGAISGGTGVSMDASGGNIIFSVEL